MDDQKPFIYGATAAAAAATTGNPAVTVIAGLGGVLAGIAANADADPAASAIFSMFAGHVSSMLDNGPSPVSVFVAGPVAALAGDTVGNRMSGARGAFTSAAAAGAIESLPAAYSLARAGAALQAARTIATRGGLPGLAGLAIYQAATRSAEIRCTSECGM